MLVCPDVGAVNCVACDVQSVVSFVLLAFYGISRRHSSLYNSDVSVVDAVRVDLRERVDRHGLIVMALKTAIRCTCKGFSNGPEKLLNALALPRLLPFTFRML